jgi:prepilin signal peptidase PulO-like enzyme (type II secretory pathway)
VNDLPQFLSAYLVLIALMVGSFINLAADRLPRGESVIRPRSHCRACGRQLNTVDLIPVVGYLLRGGRCATCRTPIGVGAPLVEGACGACMAIPLMWLGFWPGALFGIALVCGFGAAVVGLAFRNRSLQGVGL